MKYVKMLGLAAVAAMALMAFAAGSASATSLDDGAGNALGVNSKIDATLIGGTARLESTSGSVLVTCTGGTVEGVITSTNGALVEGSVAKADLTWSGCTATTDTTGGGTLRIASNNTVSGTGFEVTVNVFGSCTYGLGSTPVTLGTLEESDTNAVLNINAVVTEQTTDHFLCPNDTVWNAEYKVTSPTGLTVT